jgi:eukaryotic-like serine/threonine-protein kinase
VTSSKDRIPEDAARAIWLRAAELQAEAERRLEERARQIPAVTGDDDSESEGLRPEDVRAAAEEAGISPEFVQIALAEAAAASQQWSPTTRWDAAGSRFFLGAPPRTIELSATVPGSIDTVSAACLQAFSGHPCLLQAGEVAELSSTSGRVIVFNVPKFDWMVSANPAFVENAAYVGLKQLHVAMRPLDVEPPACDVVVAGDLHAGLRSRWRWSAATSAGVGAAGGAAGMAVAGSVLAGALPALLAAALLGGAAIAGATMFYGYYRTQVEKALRQTLQLLPAATRAMTSQRTLPKPSRS